MPSRTWSAAIASVSAGDRALAGRVQRPLRHADGGDDRADVDDRGGSDARRCGSAAAGPGRCPTTFTSSTRAHSSSSLVGHVADRADAGVVDQRCRCRRARRPPRRRCASTASRSVMSQVSRSSGSLDAGCGAVEDGDLRAARGEQRGGGGADAAGASGDDGDQAVELAHVVSLARCGRRGSSGRARRPAGAARRARRATSSRPTVAATSGPRVDRAVGVRLDGAGQPGGGAEDADRGDVLEHQRRGCRSGWACRTGRCRRPGGRARPARAPAAGSSAPLEASMTASKGSVGQVVRASRRRSKPSVRGERQRRSGRGPIRCTSAPRGAGEQRRPAGRSCPVPSDQQPVAGLEPAARTARSALPPGSTSAPSGVVDGVGQRVQRGGRDRELLGERAGPAAADARPRAGSRRRAGARQAAAAVPAAEHGVAGDPPAEPGRVDARRRPRTTVPHHSWPSRIG